MTSYHLFVLIVWSSASQWKDWILDDLGKSFTILRTFRFSWEEERFLDNLKVFYSHSQRHLPIQAYDSLLIDKASHCGTGDFSVTVFCDPNPDYQPRDTSGGRRVVNAHVFDKKQEYRQITGGGHRIHTSDDEKETNKDLTLLFGLNVEDFLKAYAANVTVETVIKKNCVGVGGYESLEQLFYVLNNSIDYCVLRNFEHLPTEFSIDGHDDIDLLVESCNYAAYLTLAKPVFPEKWRVYHLIRIDGNDIPFDLRHLGDSYYDELWEKQILRLRRFENKSFYIPGIEDLFYSLLYHAFVQKTKVSEDYLLKLKALAESLGIAFDGSATMAIHLLDSFMMNHGFEYTRPHDRSVVYNLEVLKLSEYAFRLGEFVKRTDETGGNGYVYHTVVYRKEQSYIKRGTSWLIENEVHYLEKVKCDSHFPVVLSVKDLGEEKQMEVTRVPGIEASLFFKDNKHHTKDIVIDFVKEAFRILNALDTSAVNHRDIQPSNLIVEERGKGCKVSLIDFGWACDQYGSEKAITPENLNLFYRDGDRFSDAYSFGRVILALWPELPFARTISRMLCQNETDKKAHFTIFDELRLFLRRHQRAQQLKDIIVKMIKP